jgi:hypothetical protein
LPHDMELLRLLIGGTNESVVETFVGCSLA